MRYTITYRGIPIGEVDLDVGAELTAGDVVPLAGYDAVRADVQAVTLAMDVLGFMGPAAGPLRAAVAADLAAGVDPSAALTRGAELGRELELRDSRGLPVAVDWIELMDFAGSPPLITAWVRVRTTPGTLFARNVPDPRSASEASRPEA